ncbi:hypothetical protein NE235_05310 [Actinoallomurus spadix]|uniref:hypothetical protein n=1 Tax=Actinoallomurus spadix TaxID=79912 RepID=UPI00209360E8|nr:hypothetical protein [Actinoallomurus spadix]MCO5985521.1 hypothetical protein [Actinoallomurus spadix]
MIILSGVLVVLAIALLVTGIVTGNTGHEILGLDGLKLIYVSIGVSIVSALFLAVGVFLRRKELFGTTTAPANAKASAGRTTTARPVKAKARVGAGDDAAIIPATSASPADVPDETTVYVVPGRKRYHLETCRQLAGRDKEELTFVEAREEGFTPCTACLPDTALAARAALTDTAEQRSADIATAADTRPQSPPAEPVDVTRTDIPVTRALPASEPPSAEERDGLTAARATTDETEAPRSVDEDVRDAESATTPPSDAERTTADVTEEPPAERSRRRSRSLFEPLDRAETTPEDTTAAGTAEETAAGSATAETRTTGSADAAHRDDEPGVARSTDESEASEPRDDAHDGADEAADVVAVTREVPRPGTPEGETAEPEAADRETTDTRETEHTDAETRDAEPVDDEPVDDEPADVAPADADTPDAEPADAEAPPTETDDSAMTESAPEADESESDAAASDEHDEPADDSTVAEEATGEEATGEEATGEEATGEEPAGDSTPAQTAQHTELAPAEPAEQAPEAATDEETDKAEKVEERAEAADAVEKATAESADESDGVEAAGGPTVRILSGTKRYHRSDCALIEDIADDADDLESLSREAARERGCTPCLVCQPDDD